MTSLADLKHHVRARVHSFAPGSGVAINLMELGLVPGTEVEVVRQAPFGDPLQVNVTGAHLALRRSVASIVLVEPLG